MNTIAAIKDFAKTTLGFVYPNLCQICRDHRATLEEGFVCVECWRQVRFIKPPFCKRCGIPFQGEITTEFECSNCRDAELHFAFARSAAVAKGVVLDVIHRYKYLRALWFEHFLADLLIRQAVPELSRQKWDFIVPVPLHSLKEREREFNQAERLAGFLGKATNIPIKTDLLKRVIATPTQTLLTREERATNMRNAFALCEPGKKLNGERIVLLDDVFTTGATTSACARVLQKAGAGEVCVWTVARGL